MSNIGEVLETARRARGMTQGELASIAGVQQPTLSRWEHGLREPDDSDLAKVAKALGVTPQLLRRGDQMRGGIAVAAHMRRRSTAKISIWRQLEAQLNMLRLHTLTLNEDVGVTMERSVPHFDPIDDDPAHAARMLRLQWQMPLGPVRSVSAWMESAGILIVESDFGTTARVDGLSQWGKEFAIVMTNRAAPNDRKKLTLAHELGHLVLHTDYASEHIEEEANAFAAEFLMPEAEVRPMMRGRLTLSRFVELKRYWGTSIAALVMRARGLNLINDSEKTSLFKQISARKWRLVEPLSDDVPPEEPRLARHISDSLARKGMTPEEIAFIFGFHDTSNNVAFAPTPQPSVVRRLSSV